MNTTGLPKATALVSANAIQWYPVAKARLITVRYAQTEKGECYRVRRDWQTGAGAQYARVTDAHIRHIAAERTFGAETRVKAEELLSGLPDPITVYADSPDEPGADAEAIRDRVLRDFGMDPADLAVSGRGGVPTAASACRHALAACLREAGVEVDEIARLCGYNSTHSARTLLDRQPSTRTIAFMYPVTGPIREYAERMNETVKEARRRDERKVAV